MANNENDDNVYIDLILKLYEQTEKATDKIDSEIAGLRTLTSDMIEILKHSTTNDEIIAQINETNRKIEPTLGDVSKIHTKCEAHGKDVKSINTFLSKLSMWVRTMIAVVLITFSLLTISYFFTRSSIESMVKSEFRSAKTLSDDTSDEYIELKAEFEKLRKELGYK